MAFPSAVFSLSPLLERRPASRWRAIGTLDEFPVDAMRKVVFDRRSGAWTDALPEEAVYVWRRATEEVIVFSRACTDLGCPVTWDAGSQWFFCPCHGGIFDREGVPRSGPPPRPLHRYATRIVNGAVEIDLESLPPEA